MKLSYQNYLVSIIIPTWDGKDLLKTCLTSLKYQKIKEIEVIIIDNGSTDGSVQYVRENFPDFKIVKLNKNFGFAKAVNSGIKVAKGEYIVLLNNDTEVDRDCTEYLVNTAKMHPDAGFISAKILNFYKRDTIDNAGDYLDVSGHLYTRGFGEKDSPEFQRGCYIFLASGSGCLIKREVFDRIGLFDEDFFFYMEDADFFLRAQLAGFKGWFEPKAKIYHIRRASSSTNPAFYDSLVFRNMTITILKNFPAKLLLKDFNWLKIILVHLNTIRYLFKKGYFLNVLRNELEILNKISKILQKRKQIQKMKVVSDQYIIDNIREKKLLMPRL